MKESQYLEFRFVEKKPKTRVWEVCSKTNMLRLGLIKWYGSWRQYTFFPEQGTVFNEGCLEDIRYFLISENDIQKAKHQ